MTTLYSIGHSDLPIDALLSRLGEHGIDVVVDVRSMPYSRRFPEFDLPTLRERVASSGMRYVHIPELGGRPRESSFYDDQGHVLYRRVAASSPFLTGLGRLRNGARDRRVVVMCSEEDPLRCHRWRLIGTALDQVGETMLHIRRDGRLETHHDVTLRDESEHPEAYQLQLLTTGEDHWRSSKPVRSR